MKSSYFLTFLGIFLLYTQGLCSDILHPTKTLTPSWVQSPNQHPKDIDLDDISDGYYIESTEYQVNISEQTSYYKTTKVLFDNSGVENAGQLSVTFDPQYQKLSLHELKIIREGKEIDLLGRSSFRLLAMETELSRFIYNGTYTAHCVLDDLRKDDKIVFAYSLRGFNPVFENKFFDKYYLQGYEPIGLLYVRYIIPKNRKISFKYHNDAIEPQISADGDQLSYTWEIAGTEKGEYIDYEPYWAGSLQWVECSEYDSWTEVANWASKINPVNSIRSDTPLHTYTEKIWKQSRGDRYEFLRLATDFVQNEIRYMGIETGEYSHRANTPIKIFDQRYGDCKDKSALLASILSTQGIQASLVLANTYMEYGLDKQLPSPMAFNHMVVRVDIDGRKQFLDPTITYQGGPIRDRYFPYYGKVLDIASPKELTTVERDERNKTKIVETYVLHGERKATLTVNTTYYGGEADYIRQYFKNNAKNQIQKSYLDYYTKFHTKLSKKENMTYSDDMANNIFEVTEIYEISDIGTLDNNVGKRYIPLYANHVNEKLPVITEIRFEPITLIYPVNLEYDLRIVNGNGHKIYLDKENVFYDREPYLFSKLASSENDTLKVQFRLIHHDTYIATKHVDRYVSDFADRESILNCGYFINDDGYLLGSTGTTEGFTPSWILLPLFLLTMLVSAFVLREYHRKTASNIIPLYTEAAYDRIGGWLIILLIVLIISVFRMAITFFGAESILSLSVWNASEAMVNVSPIAHKALIIFETVSNACIFALFIYCIYLLIRRRDIFPQTFLFTVLLTIFITLLDLALTWMVSRQHFQPLLMLVSPVNAIIFGAIWGTYVLRSERVKGTFVVHYGNEQNVSAHDDNENQNE